MTLRGNTSWGERLARLWILAVALGLGACAAPQKNTPDASGVLSADIPRLDLANTPPALKGWTYTGRKDHTTVQEGLGISHGYKKGDDWLTIYSYTRGQERWQEGMNDPRFAAEFARSVAEIRAMSRLGIYRNLLSGEPSRVRINGQTFAKTVFSYEESGRRVLSGLYLTGYGGKLLKYRLSGPGFREITLDLTTAQVVIESLQLGRPPGAPANPPPATRPSPAPVPATTPSGNRAQSAE